MERKRCRALVSEVVGPAGLEVQNTDSVGNF